MAIGLPAIAHDLCSRSSTPQTLVNPLRGALAQVIDPPRPIALMGVQLAGKVPKPELTDRPPCVGFEIWRTLPGKLSCVESKRNLHSRNISAWRAFLEDHGHSFPV